jgi:flavin-dependent dehydrogenase
MSQATAAAAARDRLPVVVVGGGLAGAAFALELARNGGRVVVLERSPGPHHAVCGEFVSEDAQVILGRLGLDLCALGAAPVSRFRLVKGERYATTHLPFAAVGLSRLKLDEALLVAAARAGAELVRGASVIGVEPSEDGIKVRTETRAWRASAVALATGKHPLRGFPRPPSRMVGFKLHLEPVAAARALAGFVQLVFFRGGYVGACLVENGVLSVAWVMQDRLVRQIGVDWPAQRAHLSAQSSLIGDLLAGARPLFAKPVAIAAIPYGFLRGQPIAPNVFPVGDQLAVVPSFTGDGMAIALQSGVTAARAVLAGRPAAAYQQEFVGRLKPLFRLAAGIGRLLETPATCGISIAAARLMPALVSGLAAATRLRGLDDVARAGRSIPQRSMTTK